MIERRKEEGDRQEVMGREREKAKSKRGECLSERERTENLRERNLYAILRAAGCVWIPSEMTPYKGTSSGTFLLVSRPIKPGSRWWN